MKAKETFDNFINVGHEIHCDIAPQALGMNEKSSLLIHRVIMLAYHRMTLNHKYDGKLHQLQYDCLVCVGNDANGHCLRSFAMIGRRCLLVVKGQ